MYLYISLSAMVIHFKMCFLTSVGHHRALMVELSVQLPVCPVRRGGEGCLLALPWLLPCWEEIVSFSKSDCISWAGAGAVKGRDSERLKDLVSKGTRKWEAD